MRRLLILAVCSGLAVGSWSLSGQTASVDAELEEGVAQARRGAFDEAVITLDSVARRLAAEEGRPAELARAYVYLSIAYLGLSEEQKAKANFLEALSTHEGLELTEREFPPRILQFFEEVRSEAAEPAAETQEDAVEPESVTEASEAEAEPAADSDKPPGEDLEAETYAAAAPETSEGGSKKKWLLMLAGAGAAAGGAMVLLGGGGECAPCSSEPCSEGSCEPFSGGGRFCVTDAMWERDGCEITCQGQRLPWCY